MLLSGAYFLSKSPIVAAVADTFLPTLSQTASRHGRRLHAFVFPMWFVGRPHSAIESIFKARIRSWPHRITWMCATAQEAKLFRLLGQRSIWCNQNLFCNESEFEICDVPKLYDAIYTARLDPYKRIWLAADVPRLRIITANPENRSRLKEWNCQHASLNDSFIGIDAVSKEINASGCGLALSAKEGGMFAATEYLLCGKPVVTTRSLGGRDVWFDDVNHICVEADSLSVATAVQKFNENPPPPELIRKNALQKQQIHRKTFLAELIKATKDEESLPKEIDGNWIRSRFVHSKNLETHILGHS